MESQDLDDLGVKLWSRHKVLLPDLLARLTPAQFCALFAAADHGGAGADRVEALRQHNDGRGRKGLRPTVPDWL